ncbi:restriction modification system DNA specificity domain protein [Nitrosococcus halophilus Nc 4]|uniref:Restriction modification system DNA specificity domain protein n=2 Tax=Nitrosococcus halophilus TaxID=133539 RepID=D5BZ00_NITHN|nr:restriction modification system DNA specificity domain protein [Nitrosococcus halophilus Nc 4]
MAVEEAAVDYSALGTKHDVPPGYKRTEIGVIPEDWAVRYLGDIALLERGKFSARPRNDPKFFGGDIPFIQTGDVTNSNGSIISYSQTLNDEGLRVSKLFPRNTLFFTIAANIGDVGVASFETACPDSLIAIFPKPNVEKRWLFNALRSQKKKFEGLATQNAQLNINLEKLNPYLLALPPLPEQRAIAAALSDLDALIAALDKLIAKKRAIKTAAMQQLLTGKQRLPGFEGEWEVKRLGDVSVVKTGKKNNEDKAEDGKYPFFVRSQTVERINTYSFDGEAILVPGEGGIGSIFHYVNGKFDYHQRVYKISNFAADTNGKFIYYCLLQTFNKQAMRNSVKATVDSLRLPTFIEFEFLAPCFDEQQAIATILSDMDAEITTLEARRDKTQAIKQGMMQELLTGRIRLV